MDEKMQIDSNSGVVANHINNLTYNATNPPKIKNSIMANILKHMLDRNIFSETIEESSMIPYDICTKIEYNNIVKYKQLFDNYATYYSICNNVINLIDNERVGSKQIILNSVHNKYLLFKGNYIKEYSKTGELERTIIQAHSDDILDDIFSSYYSEAQMYSTLDGYSYEDVQINMQAFLIYCFIECKILERPLVE